MLNIQVLKSAMKCSLFIIFCLMMTSIQAELQKGEIVYKKWCDGCHMDSPFAPGTIHLRKLRGDERALVTERKDLSADDLRIIVRKGMNGMPLFRRTEISSQELEALIHYIVND